MSSFAETNDAPCEYCQDEEKTIKLQETQDNQELILNLSIKEAVLIGLEKNFDIRTAIYNPRIEEADIQFEEGSFDPEIDVKLLGNQIRTQHSSFITTEKTLDTKTFTLNVDVKKHFITGTDATLTYKADKNQTNNTGSILKTRYGSELTLGITQDLLQNYGKEINSIPLKIACLQAQQSDWQTRETVLQFITQVIQAYNNLFLARQTVKIRKDSRDLSQELLERKAEEVELGALAAVELVAIRSDIADKEESIANAELRASTSEVQLKTLLGLPSTVAGCNLKVILKDTPAYEDLEFNACQLLQIAIKNRPNLQALLKSYEQKYLTETQARNLILPQLQAFGTAAINNQVRKDAGGFLPYDSRPGRYSWEAGFELIYPWGNNEAKGRLRRAEWENKQAKVSVDGAIYGIETDIDLQLTNIKGLKRIIAASKKNIEAQEENLKTEKLKLEVGLSDIRNVLIVQDSLINSKLSNITSEVAYQNALADMYRVQGIVSPKIGIQLESYLPCLSCDNVDTMRAKARKEKPLNSATVL